MFASPFDPDPNDPDDNNTRFEPYDMKLLIGHALIAWALATSLGIGMYFS